MALTTTNPALRPAATRGMLRTFASRLRSALARRGKAREAEVTLDLTRAWSFDAGRSAIEILVREGEVMVTFEADPEDHVLGRGQAFRTPRSGRVAVAAFRPSRFSVAAG